MSRSRIAPAALACALAVSTVQLPAAEAQSSGSSTSTVNQQGFDEATAKWQPLFDAASAALAKAEQDTKAAQSQRDSARAELAKADAQVESARSEVELLEGRLERADVEGRQLDVDKAQRALEAARDAHAAKEAEMTQAEEAARERADATAKAQVSVGEREAAAKGARERLDNLTAQQKAAEDTLADIDAREAAGADYTQEDWERLVADAVVEITNEYRARHGMHPLVSHDVFNDNARDWSGVLAADVNRGMDPKNVLRHAKFEDYGFSGENATYDWLGWPSVTPATATRADWAHLAEDYFTSWRDSTSGHNEGMLASDVTGIGVGVRTAADGTAFAIMQFYKLGTPDGYFLLGPDAGSRKAKASGKGFYVSTGARETLGIAPLTVDLNDRKAANPSYGSLNRGAIESVSRSTPRALAVQVSHDYAAERAEHVEAKRTLDAQVAAQTERDIAAQEALTIARRQLDDASSAQHTAEAQRDRLAEEAATLSGDVTAAQAALDAAAEELEWAKSVDREKLEADITTAEERLAEAEQAAEDAYLSYGNTQQALDEAEDEVADAKAEVARVAAQRPTVAQFTTTETDTAAVVIGVLAALAVVGIGVVALAPRLGIELPWQ
ncbi:CAP domain-containing protein [Corynebacterium wankanglinii]|uniref:SCP domain-containing protein n=1 Tax=Corynebacterium wankanglinii TaxID=2735136 RepID=A0A838CM31_9CORY|nr:CAP domain-containing protein [Corynebacterium wankanglinii]MBA1836007.1 hypothetical protein [Corynebacterium wankanglinii]